MIGRRVGRFLVTGKLGQGGMATVWRAEDELLRRPVAIKLLAEHLAASPEARRRFVHEAHTASSLNHPGIAAVYDYGETGETAWLAMALIEGETLGDRIRRRLLPLDEAVRIVCAAADALGFAHAHGVTHRDVSSRNIMVAGDGRVYVLDFGLALAQGQSRVTTSNTTIGTISYLSPEVALGEGADARSDLYGLGVVLYEALTGALPFESDRAEAVLYAIVNRPPLPPRERRPEIPADLESIVMHALAKRPQERPGSARELAVALRDWLESRAQASGGERAPSPPGGAGTGRSAPAAGATGVHEPPPAPWSSSSGPEEPTVPPHSPSGAVYLAVLPFEDLGSGLDPEGGRQALAQGLAETVSAALARLDRVHVIPPAPGGAPPPAGAGARELARHLGANLLLHGTVRSAGTQIRLAYSLLDPHSGVQVGGDTVDGFALGLFDLENRLIASLRRALGHEMVRDEFAPRARPPGPADHELYLKALGYLRRYDDEGSVDAAIRLLEGIVPDPGAGARVHAALGRAYLCKQQLTAQRVWEDRAASACERALELDADDPDVLVTRAELRHRVGRHEEAVADFRRALELRPDHFEALLGLAHSSLPLGRLDEAERVARRAVELRHRDWRGHNMLAFVFFRRGEYARAVTPWRRAARLSPENARVHCNLGSAYLQLDQLVPAVAAYRRSLEIQPDASTYTNLGTALFYLRQSEEAVEAFGKAAALKPASAISWGNLGSALHYLPGRERESDEALERAIAMMREHLQRDPADADGWQRMAQWLANLGQAVEAKEAAARALALAPHETGYLGTAAEVHCQLGEKAEALRLLQQALVRGYPTTLVRRSADLGPLFEEPEFKQMLEKAENAERDPAASQSHEGGRA